GVSSSGGQYRILTDFPGVPLSVSTSTLVRDRSGNLYGTSQQGGDLGGGAAWKLDTSDTVTVLHSFGAAGDGDIPAAGLALDAAGNLYGTTQYGGVDGPACTNNGFVGCGIVFELDPSGNETVLYSFSGKGDGAYPVAALLLDPEGNLYGTA